MKYLPSDGEFVTILGQLLSLVTSIAISAIKKIKIDSHHLSTALAPKKKETSLLLPLFININSNMLYKKKNKLKLIIYYHFLFKNLL